MKGLDSVRRRASAVAATLRDAGFDSHAEPLEAEIRRLDEPETRLAALRLIRDLCHIKALGDVNVPAPSERPWQWTRQLDDLSRACDRLARRLRRSATGR